MDLYFRKYNYYIAIDLIIKYFRIEEVNTKEELICNVKGRHLKITM